MKWVVPKAARVVLVGAILTCVAGAVMHFTCTSMLWYFVKSGAMNVGSALMFFGLYHLIWKA